MRHETWDARKYHVPRLSSLVQGPPQAPLHPLCSARRRPSGRHKAEQTYSWTQRETARRETRQRAIWETPSAQTPFGQNSVLSKKLWVLMFKFPHSGFIDKKVEYKKWKPAYYYTQQQTTQIRQKLLRECRIYPLVCSCIGIEYVIDLSHCPLYFSVTNVIKHYIQCK